MSPRLKIVRVDGACTPPKASSIATGASIRSGSVCVQVAMTNSK